MWRQWLEQESKEITWSGKSPGWRRRARCQTAEGVSEGGTRSGAGQRGQEACVSETREGAVVGKEAVVHHDESLQKGQL